MSAVMSAPAAAATPEAPPGSGPPPAAAAPPGTAAPPGALASPGAPPGEGGAPPQAPFVDLLNAQVARTATAEGQHKTAADIGGHAKTDITQDPTAEALASAVAAVAVPVAPVSARAATPAAPAQQAPGHATPVQPGDVKGQSDSASSAAVPNTNATPPAAPNPRPALETHFADVQAAVTPPKSATATSPKPATPPTPEPTAEPTAAPKTPGTPQNATAPQTTTTPDNTATTPQTQPPTSAQPENRASSLLSALSGSVHMTRTPAAAPANGSAPTPVSATAAPASTSDPAHTGTTDQSERDDARQPATANLPTPALDNATASASAAPSTPARFELPAPQAPVTLPRAAQAMQETIALAARQGATLARIQLSPESLGPISIHLQHTADGVVARVVAGPEAAQHFQQGADDLRRSLQASGVNLIGLQIETSSGRDAQAQAQAQAQSSRRQNANARTRTAAQDSASDPVPSITRLEPLHSTSISVLA